MKLHEIYALIASPYGVTGWRIDTLLSRYQHLFLPLHQTARLPTPDEIEEVLQGIERQRLERNITLAEHSVLRTIVFARVAYEIGKKEAEAAASFMPEPVFAWDKQHKAYTLQDWKQEVGEGNTMRGYNDWVHAKLEQNRDEGDAEVEDILNEVKASIRPEKHYDAAFTFVKEGFAWVVAFAGKTVTVNRKGETREYELPDKPLEVRRDGEYIYAQVHPEGIAEPETWQFKLEDGDFLVGDVFNQNGDHLHEFASHVFGEDQ